MDWLIIWIVLILVMALLGWLACTYFWRYYAIFKHLVWGCLVLLVGFLSYDYGVDRGTWVVRDAQHVAREVRADDFQLNSNSSAAQENAKIPFLYDTIVARLSDVLRSHAPGGRADRQQFCKESRFKGRGAGRPS